MENVLFADDHHLPQEGEAGRDKPAYAGFFCRLLALELDLLVVVMLYWGCFSWAAYFLWGNPVTYWWGILPALSLYALFLVTSFPIFALCYFCLLHAWQGQTVGKMCLGIKVVDEQGCPPSVGLAFLRLIGLFFSIVLGGIGVLWVIIDPEKRGWHDALARTRVVYRK